MIGSSMARAAVTVCAFLVCAAPAQAVDLIGETLTFRRLYPDFNTEYGPPFEPRTVTVVAGDGDTASWIVDGSVYLQAMPEATAITLLMPAYTGYGYPQEFDGYSISGFSMSTAAVSVSTNTTPFDVQLTSLGDTLYIGLSNPGVYGSGQIVLDFTSAVPEPGTWALFGVGLLAIGRIARRPRPAEPVRA